MAQKTGIRAALDFYKAAHPRFREALEIEMEKMMDFDFMSDIEVETDHIDAGLSDKDREFLRDLFAKHRKSEKKKS